LHSELTHLAYGLRRKEAVSIRPYIHFVNNDLHVIDGSKGGKPRTIPVENEFQEWVRNEAKRMVGMTSVRLCHPQLSLKQEIDKYNNTMKKHGITKNILGVTGHGLRHEYSHEYMLSKGLMPSVKGEQEVELSPDEQMKIRLETSQRLGHYRVSITTAYSGKITKRNNESKYN